MSSPKDETEDRRLEQLLAATPDRVLDAGTGGDPAARAELDAEREVLGLLALSLDPVSPSPSLRQRLAQAIEREPRTAPRRAVVVMDMQRDHLTPGRPLEVPRAREIVPSLRARLDEAHAQGVPVIYLCDRHQPGDPELEVWGTHNVAGSEGAEVWPELAPRDGDRVIYHRGYNGFQDTSLAETLGELRVDTVVLTGCVAEIHVFVTAAEAMARGYAVEVPPACVAGSSPVTEAVVLATLGVMRPVLPFAAPSR